MNLYSRKPGAFTETSETAGWLPISPAAGAFSSARTHAQMEQAVDGMRAPISRASRSASPETVPFSSTTVRADHDQGHVTGRRQVTAGRRVRPPADEGRRPEAAHEGCGGAGRSPTRRKALRDFSRTIVPAGDLQALGNRTGTAGSRPGSGKHRTEAHPVFLATAATRLHQAKRGLLLGPVPALCPPC